VLKEPEQRGVNVDVMTTMSVPMRGAIGRAAAARQLSVSGWIRCAVREQLKAERIEYDAG
jgi:hypothetical protein